MGEAEGSANKAADVGTRRFGAGPDRGNQHPWRFGRRSSRHGPIGRSRERAPLGKCGSIMLTLI